MSTRILCGKSHGNSHLNYGLDQGDSKSNMDVSEVSYEGARCREISLRLCMSLLLVLNLRVRLQNNLQAYINFDLRIWRAK